MMNCARPIRFRSFSWLVIVAMLMMSFWMAGQTSVNAIDDAVVNITTGVGYGDDLRAALSAANDDDIIHVYEGTYESISINTPLSLIAPNGPASVTIMHATGLTDHAIFVGAVDVLLRGLTIASDEYGILVSGIANGSLAIEDCVFDDRTAMAVRIGKWGMSNDFVNAQFSFTGNVVTGGSYGVYFLTEISDSSITLSGNTFNGNSSTYAIYFEDDVYDSSILIEDNAFETFDGAVSGGGNQDYGLRRTSVDIIGNTFSDGNVAIDLYRLLDDTDVLIKDNNIEDCDIGINPYYIGDNSDIGVFAPCSVIIRDNTLNNIGQYGISIDNYMHGIVSIMDNIISNCGYYGVYLDMNPQNSFQNQTSHPNQIDLDIVGNQFTSCDESGIYFSNLDTIPTNGIDILIRKNSFYANNTGLVIADVLLHANPEQLITITLNDFIENGTGIRFGDIRFYDFSADHMPVLLNQFIGNRQHAVIYQPRSEALEAILATQNWWGDESGPVVVVPDQFVILNTMPSGDPVSENVIFDPWLAQLVITPVQSSMTIGETQVLTAQIIDNEGNPVTADGLTVLFNISGVHTSEMSVPFSAVSAVKSYTGSSVGTDTIRAEVFFAGAPSGLATEIQIAWATQSASPTPTQPAPTQPDPTPTQPAPTPTDPAPSPTDSAPTPTQPAGSDVSGDDQEIPQTGERGNNLFVAGVVLLLFAFSLVIVRRKQQRSGSEHGKN